jgi:hypothetical protein
VEEAVGFGDVGEGGIDIAGLGWEVFAKDGAVGNGLDGGDDFGEARAASAQ